VEETKVDMVNLVRNYFGSEVVNASAPNSFETWVNFICDGGDGGKIYPGDHLESASPADPSFWVIHPTLERLLHFKMMNGGFEADSWVSDQVNDYVCNNANCYDLATNSRSYAESCCYGHYENDRLYNGIIGDKTSFVGQTNAELRTASNPLSKDYSLSYVYDGFTWDHCEEDFEGLGEQMYLDGLERDIAGMNAGLRRTAEASTTRRRVPRPASQEDVRALKKNFVSHSAKKG